LSGEIRSESVCEAGSRGQGGGVERGTDGDLSGVSRAAEWITEGINCAGGCEEAHASWNVGGSESGSVEADEKVLGGEESEEGLDTLDKKRLQ
jgi:hypothetical protein